MTHETKLKAAETLSHDDLCPMSREEFLTKRLAERGEELERMRTAIFNTINDLGRKKPNIRAIRSYLSGVYNAGGDEQNTKTGD